MNQSPLAVTFDTGETRHFESLVELKEWAENERRLFKWMNATLVQHTSANLLGILQRYRETLVGLIDRCEASDWKDASVHLSRIDSEFKGLLSESKIPAFLAEVARRNPRLANAALALSVGAEKAANFQDQAHTAGQFWAAEALLTAFNLSPPAIQVDIRKLLAEAGQLRDGLSDQLSKFAASSEEAAIDHKSAISDRETRFAEGLESNQTAFSKFMDESRQEFEKQREYFKTELSLQAPILYWKSVAESSGHWSKVWGAIFALEVALLLGFLYFKAGDLLDFLNKNREAADLGVVIALVVASSTLALWAMRMTARIFLSNYHRSADAGERTTMLQTFLALRHKRKIDDDQIALVLGAIFRPGATGLVKDDAAPEFGAAALLSRFDRK